MHIWSSSTVLLLIDSIAISIAQGYMLARARLAAYPSPILRVSNQTKGSKKYPTYIGSRHPVSGKVKHVDTIWHPLREYISSLVHTMTTWSAMLVPEDEW